MADNQIDVTIKANDQASAIINKITAQTSSAFGKLTALSFGVNQVFDLGKRAMQVYSENLGAVIDETVAYADEVRQLQQVTGASAEETSRLIQVLDDYKVSTADAMAAQRNLTKDGIVLTTKSLAELSKQYLAITDQAERNAFAQDKLGRNYKAFIEILQQGPTAINAMSDAIDDNLVMSQEAIDTAREYQFQIDELSDSFLAFRNAAGKQALPIVTNALSDFNDKAEESGFIIAVLKTGFDDIALALAKATNLYKLLNQEVERGAQSGRRYADANEDVFDSLEKFEELQRIMIDLTTQYNQSVIDGVEQTSDRYRAFTEDIQAHGDKIAEIEAAITLALKQGYSERGQKIKDLRADLANERDAVAQTQAAYERQTKAVLLGYIERKLALDGLTNAETEYILNLGEAWGVYQAGTAEMYREEIAKAEDYARAIQKLDGKFVTITVFTNYVEKGYSDVGGGTKPKVQNPVKGQKLDQMQASGTGGDWLTVPAGYPNDSYTVGMTSGEKYSVATQAGKPNAGGGTVDLSRGSAKLLAREIVNAMQKAA